MGREKKDMVHFIYGRTGSGKSSFMYDIASKTVRGKHIFVLTPDREAVIAERRFAASPNAGDIDVVTFRRLCDFVFRKYGGVCENYISRGAKTVMMYNTFRALSGLLESHSGDFSGDIAAAKRLLEMRSELRKNAVTPGDISSAVKNLRGETGKKLSDIALIFSAFDAEVSSRFADPEGVTEKMNEKLSENDFFRGCDVYIDSFIIFSKEQLFTLREIMRGADDVYISLPYIPYEDKDIPCFFCASETDRKLRDAANAVGAEISEDTFLASGKRAENAELSFLSENLFSAAASSHARYRGKCEHIRIIGAADAFAEAEAVCLDICKKVRGGARYRDFAVIVRNESSYSGIIDAVMKKYRIPYFISTRTDITEKAFIKFLLAALSVAERGFLREIVISYIKTDFAGISPDEINLFENYVRKWNINGARFSDGYDWNMNPEGYSDKFTQEDADKLIKIAEIRKRVVLPLQNFKEELSGEHTVSFFCEKLYSFAVNAGTPEKIKSDAERANESGDKALSSELTQLFSAFCDTLDALVSASGDVTVNVGEFIPLFKTVISETDIGKIPTSLDEVTVYDASAGGIHGAKTAYLMGAYDGGFPARAEDDGLFTEKERALLLSAGIELSYTLENRLCDELYYFYAAACSPSCDLVITYPYHAGGERTSLSAAACEIKEMFGLKDERFEETGKRDLIERPSASFEYAAESGNISLALKEYYSEREEYRDKLEYVSLPLTARNCRMSYDAAKELFPKNMKMSYSRLEKYVNCNFAYFCEYELYLKDSSPAKFEKLNKGSLVHRILEVAVKYAMQNSEASEKEIKEKIKEVCCMYTEKLLRENYAEISPRISGLADYLCRASEKFVFEIRDEFRESRFTPKDFELTIGDSGDIAPLRIENANGGVFLKGKIDRVDAFDDGTGKIFIRVADYKTGKKKFEMKNVEAGLDLQMLLYLFSVCENGKKRYGSDILPAGVMYVLIDTSPEKENIGACDVEKSEKCGRSGVFLDDENVLRAMEPLLGGKFIPVTEKKLGKKSENLVAAEGFGELKTAVVNAVLRASDSLRQGVADAKPYDENICGYCKMRPVCRMKNNAWKGK